MADDRQTQAAATRLDPLKQALGGYLAIPGIKAALLISDQGLLVSSMAKEGVDTASIAAWLSTPCGLLSDSDSRSAPALWTR